MFMPGFDNRVYQALTVDFGCRGKGLVHLKESVVGPGF
jgi:hypothetical protein